MQRRTDDNRGHVIRVEKIRTEPGTYEDAIVVQTGSPRRPEYVIHVSGRIE
jgi:hypothetical protein